MAVGAGSPLKMADSLASRYNQLKEFFAQKPRQHIVSDYHIIKSFLFASHNLEPAEFELYKSFYNIIAAQIPEPDVVIYLDPGISQLQKNIRKRGRDFETRITENYLIGISKAYQNLLKNHPFSKLIMIDSANMDFVNNKNDYQFIINKLNG